MGLTHKAVKGVSDKIRAKTVSSTNSRPSNRIESETL